MAELLSSQQVAVVALPALTLCGESSEIRADRAGPRLKGIDCLSAEQAIVRQLHGYTTSGLLSSSS